MRSDDLATWVFAIIIDDFTKDELVNELLGSILNGLRRLERVGENLAELHKALGVLDDEIWIRIDDEGPPL